jgi:hypothetical protein
MWVAGGEDNASDRCAAVGETRRKEHEELAPYALELYYYHKNL